MKKRGIFNIFGILLSFAIAIGGWALASRLMDIRSDNLMSATGVSPILMPLQLPPQADAVPAPEYIAEDYTVQLLSEQNMVSILRNLDAPGRQIPHEPTPEQITLDHAIRIGWVWFENLSRHIEMQVELLEFHDIDAHLSQNVQRGVNGFLPPEYSFWTVTFIGRFMTTTLLINAVSGQVWRTDLVLSPRVMSLEWEFQVVADTSEVTVVEVHDQPILVQPTTPPHLPYDAFARTPRPLIYFNTTIEDAMNALSEFMDTIGIVAEGSPQWRITESFPNVVQVQQHFAGGEGFAAVNFFGTPYDRERWSIQHFGMDFRTIN